MIYAVISRRQHVVIQEWRDGLAAFQYGATEDSFVRTVIRLDVD